jgi:hypothetical protein
VASKDAAYRPTHAQPHPPPALLAVLLGLHPSQTKNFIVKLATRASQPTLAHWCSARTAAQRAELLPKMHAGLHKSSISRAHAPPSQSYISQNASPHAAA